MIYYYQVFDWNQEISIISYEILDESSQLEKLYSKLFDRKWNIKYNIDKHGFCYDNSYLYWSESKISAHDLRESLRKNSINAPSDGAEIRTFNMIIEYLRQNKIDTILNEIDCDATRLG